MEKQFKLRNAQTVYACGKKNTKYIFVFLVKKTKNKKQKQNKTKPDELYNSIQSGFLD
jgi:hypothetical protein